MTSCVQLFANFKKVVKIQSFENFLTDECCSSLLKLLSKWCKIHLFEKSCLMTSCVQQEGCQNSELR